MTDISGITSNSAAPVSASTGIAGNQQFSTDMFLQLLVTQLRYQDPMSGGQDTGELITQLTMFTLLEQVVKLQQTVESQAQFQGNQQALNLLNREVEVAGADGAPVRGLVSAVDLSSAVPYLTVDGYDYPLSALLRVEGGSEEDDQ